jgi:2-polyprenyl-3-methyl-5-hydroxy-6-metoxy-1,4-benzoquinol methylase
MSAPTASGSPSPDLFFQTINAYQATASLRAAIELELFTAIGEGNTTPETIAQRTAASVKGVRVLSDYLTVLGFLTKNDGAYQLTGDSAMFLDKRSPAYMGGTTRFLLSPDLKAKFENLTDVVRKGGTLDGEGTMEPDHPIWRDFARSMAPLVALPAEMTAQLLGASAGGPWKVLDLAAGHGLFGIAIAKANPGAEIVALDWASVLEVARENAEAAGVGARHTSKPGSAFEVDFGGGYDVVLITNFLHHFDTATCEALLRKVHACLKPGGRAAALEFVPDEDRVSPPMAATFSMIMLGSTAHGDAYTFSELARMFANAGFAKSEMHEMPPTPHRLVISHKQDR